MAGASVPQEIEVAIICQHMGWTFQEYASQPQWLITAIKVKLEEDSAEAERQNRSIKRK